MSREESQKAYDALNFEGIKEKSAEIMLEIVRQPEIGAGEVAVFEKVKEIYTNDELAYIACCHIGIQLRDALKDPNMKVLMQTMRAADKLGKEMFDEAKKK